MKYRKKPVVIDAFKFGFDPMPYWFLCAIANNSVKTYRFTDGPVRGELDFAIIQTLEGRHRANRGDFIIQGVKGELYPCKPDIFALTHEKVSDEKSEVFTVEDIVEGYSEVDEVQFVLKSDYDVLKQDAERYRFISRCEEDLSSEEEEILATVWRKIILKGINMNSIIDAAIEGKKA